MKRIKWNFLIASLFCLCSCADLTELNENPTKATSISPHLLIPTIQLTHSQYLQSTLRYLIFPGAFVNHWIGGWSMQEYGGKCKSASTTWSVSGRSTIRKLSKPLSLS